MKVSPFALLSLLLLSGCASQIPREIGEPPAVNPLFSQVQENPKTYQGWAVRWGGEIVSVENKPNETWLEVLAKQLDSQGRPVESDESLGRFLVKAGGFFDPAIYRVDRRITIYGMVEGQETRKIGNLPYNYPIIKGEKLYLWPEYPRYGYPDYYPYGYYPPYYYPYPRFHFGFHRHFW